MSLERLEQREPLSPGLEATIYMCQGHMVPPPLPRGMVYPPAPPVGLGFGILPPPRGCGVWDLSSIAADIAAASCQDHLQHVVSLLPY